MKAISLSLLAVFCVVSVSFGQYQPVSGKAVIKTPTVQCETCQSRVEAFLGRQYGVSTVRVNTRQKTTTVTWLNDRTNLENIKVYIANLGFDADDIEREESAFKRLPKDCKLHPRPVKPPVVEGGQ